MERVSRHIETLQKRRDYVHEQARTRSRAGLPADYALAERAALDYALAVIDDARMIAPERFGSLTARELRAARMALADEAVAS